MSKDTEQSKESQLNQSKEQQMAISFLFACQKGDLETANKMIFEENIEYTQAIQVYFKQNPTSIHQAIQSMFEKRELNKKLNQDLKHNDTPNKITKI